MSGIYSVYSSLYRQKNMVKKHTYPSVIHSLKTVLIFQGFCGGALAKAQENEHDRMSDMEKIISEFFESSQQWIEIFNAWSRPLVSFAAADHICYKCSSSEEFESLRAMFEHESIFLYQSIISQRRIAIVKFTQPIGTILGDIWLLELSDQKPDGSQASGFDHVEIYPTTGSLESLVETIEANGTSLQKVVRPHHTTFDLTIKDNFKVRLEPEPLLEKIQREEMR